MSRSPSLVRDLPATRRGWPDGLRRFVRAARMTRQLASRRELGLPYPLDFKLRAWSRGFSVEHAVIYDLDHVDASGYLTDYAHLHRCTRLNPIPQLFNQKLLLRRILADRGFVQPDTIALVTEHGVIEDPVHVGTPSSPSRLEARLVADGGRFIVKPQNGRYGRGILLVEVRDGRLVAIHGTKVRPLRLDRDLPPNTVVERRMEQHAFWDALSPSSFNTLRILTLWTPGDDRPFVARAVQRMGTRDTVPTDNWDSGGVLATVDLATGRLGAGRVNRFRSALPDRPYPQHPDTGAQIEGAVLPAWSEILDTVLQAARSLPMARYIGWDVGVDPAGRAAFIEGNNNTGLRALQVAGGLLTDPAIRRFYQAVGVV